MSDPWHIGPRMRYWRERRGIPRQTFAELVGRSRSWVEMAETGHRVPYNVLDLVSVARALRVDLAAFLCDPIPDLPDGEQQQLLATLRDAFMGDDPRAGLARLAHRLADMEPGHELMLVSSREVNGRWSTDATPSSSAPCSESAWPRRPSTLTRRASWSPPWRAARSPMPALPPSAPSSRPTDASMTRSGPPPSGRWSSTTSRSSRGCKPGPRTSAPH